MTMTTTDTDVLTREYLKRLDKALAPLPRARRAQLVAEIAEHVATARAQLERPTDADIESLLDRMGRPEDIAAEAMGLERPVSPSGRWMTRIGLVLLPVAGVLIAAELIGGVTGAVHYILRSGITAKRREWSIAFFIVVGVIGPITASLVLFDLLKTGMTWKSRLGLVGFLGSVIGGVAVLVFIGFWFL
jgi:uncharacterized membrane protein